MRERPCANAVALAGSGGDGCGDGGGAGRARASHGIGLLEQAALALAEKGLCEVREHEDTGSERVASSRFERRVTKGLERRAAPALPSQVLVLQLAEHRGVLVVDALSEDEEVPHLMLIVFRVDVYEVQVVERATGGGVVDLALEVLTIGHIHGFDNRELQRADNGALARRFASVKRARVKVMVFAPVHLQPLVRGLIKPCPVCISDGAAGNRTASGNGCGCRGAALSEGCRGAALSDSIAAPRYSCSSLLLLLHVPIRHLDVFVLPPDRLRASLCS